MEAFLATLVSPEKGEGGQSGSEAIRSSCADVEQADRANRRRQVLCAPPLDLDMAGIDDPRGSIGTFAMDAVVAL